MGGKIEEGETPLEAMNREFKEETGLDFINWELFCELETVDGSAHVFFFHKFMDGSISLKQMTEEPILLILVESIHKVACIPNLRWLIPMCFDPQHISGTVICNASMK